MTKMSESESFCPANRQEWRDWLQENHDKKPSIWLIYFKKESRKPSIVYSEAVDEALCFGWIDSKSKPIDGEKYMQFFSKRKPKSVWSKINKEKIERLTEQGLMTKSGFDCIEIAKTNGSWNILDEAEALIIPNDLEEAYLENPNAKSYFLSLSKSDKRNILQWLVLAKRPDTRQNRIKEIVTLALQGQKPRQFRGKKE